jgi:hypothetical protein
MYQRFTYNALTVLAVSCGLMDTLGLEGCLELVGRVPAAIVGTIPIFSLVYPNGNSECVQTDWT